MLLLRVGWETFLNSGRALSPPSRIPFWGDVASCCCFGWVGFFDNPNRRIRSLCCPDLLLLLGFSSGQHNTTLSDGLDTPRSYVVWLGCSLTLESHFSIAFYICGWVMLLLVAASGEVFLDYHRLGRDIVKNRAFRRVWLRLDHLYPQECSDAQKVMHISSTILLFLWITF